jgi:outer membrane protein TolC
MRIILMSFFTVICICSGVAFGQITLEECHTKSKENFPLIRQYELIEQTKEYTLSNAQKAYLPQLDVTLIGGIIEGMPTLGPPGTESSSPNFQLISVLQLNQVIWDGGITKARKSMIEAGSEIEKADLEVSLYQLEDRVNNMFFGVLLIEEQIQQMKVLKSTLQRNLKRVEIAVENGTAFKSDIDEIRVEVINSDQRMDELRFNRAAYVNVLAAMIGEPIEANSKFTRPEVNDSFQGMDVNRPELTLFQNQEYLIAAQNKIDKAMLYPKIGFLGFGTFIQPGVEFGTSTLNSILVAGLSVNWSLGGVYKNSNNKKLTELNMQKVNVQRETFLFNTNLELTQTGTELEKYKTLINQDKELVALKSKIKNAYDVKYENGVSTMSEVLDRTNDESIAKQKLVAHEIQYLMKAYQYLNKSGN